MPPKPYLLTHQYAKYIDDFRYNKLEKGNRNEENSW